MEQSKGKIGLREYVAIILFTVGVKLSDDTPAILADHLSTAYWMAPLISGMIYILPLFLLIQVITTYQNKNLYDCIVYLFGKFFGQIISVILLLAFFNAITIDTSTYVDIIGTMYFTNTPAFAIYIVLIAVCAYGAKRGLEQIGSISWVVLFYVLITLVFVFLLTVNQNAFAFIYPIFGPGINEVVKQSAAHVSIFADFFYLGLIAPYVVTMKDFKKGTYFAYFFVIIEMTISFLIYLFIFDYEPLKTLNYPYHEVIKIISVGFLTNIESFFLPIWLIATFIRFTFYLYLIALFFGGIFNIKNFEYLIPALAAIVVILGLIPEAPTFTIFVLKDSLFKISSPIFISLPVIMWIIAKLKGDFKHNYGEKTS